MISDIKIYENFLSEKSLELLNKTVENIFNHKDELPIFSSSFSHWDKNLIKSSTPILRYFLNERDIDLTSLLINEIENRIPYYIGGIIIHIMPKLSYIPWHNDAGHSAALTIYLNENWNPDWGGFFMYRTENEIKAIRPIKNTAILQSGGVVHSVSTINMDADYRISLQCFLNNKKKLL